MTEPVQDDEDQTAAATAPATRRLQFIAVLALAVSAALLWTSSRMTWAKVYAVDGQDKPRTFEVLGADWSPWLVAVALVLLAAAAVQFAVKGNLRRIVSVIVALIAVAVSVPAISLITEGQGSEYAARVADVPANYGIDVTTAEGLPGFVVLLGALFALIGAVAMLRSAKTGTAMSSKYSSPAARREELERKVFAERERAQAGDAAAAAPAAGAPDTERELWEALDHGVDPTEDADRDR